jgi:hypothetical protein
MSFKCGNVIKVPLIDVLKIWKQVYALTIKIPHCQEEY